MSGVNIEKTKYGDFGECFKLSNSEVELYVTLDLGPRVICYKAVDGENVLGEIGKDTVVNTEYGDWRPWGGHRLWHAPEAKPRSYVPDDGAVISEQTGNSTVRVSTPCEQETGIQKDMLISMEREGSQVTITHMLKNTGAWPVEIAPWAITIMKSGGMTVFPQEPFKAHADGALLPARPLTLWPYTDMTDPRWRFGRKYIVLNCSEKQEDPQKVGAAVKAGWAGYVTGKSFFVKRFQYKEGAKYPDFGCNFETFTAGAFMEIESLGPLAYLQPGETATHVEHWYLFSDVDAGDTENSLEKTITPLVKKTTTV